MRFVLLLLSMILFTGCDSTDNLTDAESIASAQDLLDNQELNSAVIQLKNALKQNPKNAEARWLLGKVYLDTENGPAAEKELRIALKLGVSNESVLPLMARSLLLQGKFEDVQELAIDPAFSDRTIAELLASRGLSFVFQNEFDKAQKELDDALERDPLSTYALVERARLAFVRHEYEDTRGFIGRAFNVDAKYTPAWGLLGDLERAQNNPEAALEAYSTAVNNSYHSIRDLQRRALVYIQLKEYEKAQADVKELKNYAPRHPLTNYTQGLIYFGERRLPQAQASFQQVLTVNENHWESVFYLGATQMLQKNIEQASDQLSRFVTAKPRSIQGRKLLASIRLGQQDYEAAEELIRPVANERTNDVVALNILADALLYQGEMEEAILLNEQIASLRPESAAALARLGIGQLLHGDEAEGIKSLELAADVDPEFQQADVLLIKNYLGKNKLNKAQEAALAFTDRQPQNPVAWNLLGMTRLARREDDQAARDFETARKLDPGNPLACHKLAILALRKQETGQAQGYLDEVLKYHQGHLPTLLIIASLEGREGHQDKMESTFLEAIRAHPDTVTPRVMLAREYLRANRASEALSIIDRKTRTKHAKNPMLLGVLGEAQLASGEFREARHTLDRLVELRPNSARAHFHLAKAYAGLNDGAALRRELEKVLNLEPGNLPARITLAKAWLKEGDIIKAEEQLESIQPLTHNNPVVLELEGEILVKSGKPVEALAVYRKLYSLYPNTRNLLLLTKFQWLTGDIENSIPALEQWLSEHPDDIDIKLTLAGAYIKTDRKADALGQYKRILEIAGNNPVALNDLAWQLKDSDLEQARELAEKAYSLAPHSAAILDTLVTILLLQNDTARAEQMLDNALKLKPRDPSLIYKKALVFEATGEFDTAVRILSRLLEDKQAFPERAEATRLLKRLADS